MSLRSPLGRVRGLGSAKEGSHHWWVQRLTAVALVPLSLWFIVSLTCLTQQGYTETIRWISQPISTVLLIMFSICSLLPCLPGCTSCD